MSPQPASRQAILEQARRALERRFEALCGRPLRLRLNANRHTYFSVSFPKGEPARLNLHRCFAEAPDDVLAAVAEMMKGRSPRAAERCRRFVAQHDRTRLSAGQPVPLPPSLRRTKGRHHDLKELAQEVNQRYFQGALAVRITWGKNSEAPDDGAQPGRRKRRQSLRYGSYDHSLDLVRINRILDSQEAPRFYLDFLIYHELLHKALGVKEGARRRPPHHAEFRRREKQHEHYQEAMAWEKQFFEQVASGRRRARSQTGVSVPPLAVAKKSPAVAIAPGKPHRKAVEPQDATAAGNARGSCTQLTLFDSAPGKSV